MSEALSIYPQSLIDQVREASEQLQTFQEKYKDVFTPTSDARISDMVTDCAGIVDMMLKEVE